MKRLLVFHPAPAPYRVDFFNALGRHFVMHLVFWKTDAPEIMVAGEKLLRDATFTYEYLPTALRFCGRTLSLGYAKTIRHFRPDIVLSAEFDASLLFPLLLRPVLRKSYKLYTLCDDSLQMAEARQGGRRKRAFWMLHHADGLLVTTPQAARWYQDHAPVKRIGWFPIIADEQLLLPRRQDITSHAMRHIEQYQLEGRRVGLFVGRFVEVKNLPRLLSAFADATGDLSDDWRLVMVGDGEEESQLHRQAEELEIADKVIFAGRHTGDALMAWYTVASFLVLPSRQEAFGAVVGEALQLGCRTLVSQWAGVSGMISGDAGEVFCPDDADAFSALLARHYREAAPTPREGFKRASLFPFSFESLMQSLTTFLSDTTK